MALRDQPYLPLYVDRFSADEDLRYCSASATGVHIRVMCLFHKTKSAIYGTIPLKDEFALPFAEYFAIANAEANGSANSEQVAKPTCKQLAIQFAKQFAKQLPYAEEEILSGILELIKNGVYFFDGVNLCQGGMIKQGQISDSRKDSGLKGVKKKRENQKKNKNFAIANTKANGEAKAEAKYITTTTTTNISNNVGENIGGMGEKEGEEFENLDELKVEVENYVREVSYEVGEFLEVYFKSPKYSVTREQLGMANHMDLDMLREWAKAFNIYLITSGTDLTPDGKTVKGESDWAKHFKFWLQKQDKNQNPRELHTKTHTQNGKKPNTNGAKNLNEDYKRELLAKMAQRAG